MYLTFAEMRYFSGQVILSKVGRLIPLFAILIEDSTHNDIKNWLCFVDSSGPPWHQIEALWVVIMSFSPRGSVDFCMIAARLI